MYRYLLLTISLLCSSLVLYGQGVSIADDTLPPNPYAIMDIRAVSRGVLIPRMTYTEMTQITNKSGATMVYVIDENDNQGFWFYNSRYSEWQQLKFKKSYYPMGSIIMYTGDASNFGSYGIGKTGTELEGWALCNGYNGTPDLSDRFIVTASDQAEYKNMGPSTYTNPTTGGDPTKPENQHMLNANVFCSHTHKLPQKDLQFTSPDHGHDVEEGTDNHRHPLAEVEGDPEHNLIEGQRGKRDAESKSGYRRRREARKGETYTLPVEYTHLIVKENDATAIQNFKKGPIEMTPAKGTQVAVENRPPYYVVAYIMRTKNSSFDFKTYTKQDLSKYFKK